MQYRTNYCENIAPFRCTTSTHMHSLKTSKLSQFSQNEENFHGFYFLHLHHRRLANNSSNNRKFMQFRTCLPHFQSGPRITRAPTPSMKRGGRLTIAAPVPVPLPLPAPPPLLELLVPVVVDAFCVSICGAEQAIWPATYLIVLVNFIASACIRFDQSLPLSVCVSLSLSFGCLCFGFIRCAQCGTRSLLYLSSITSN